MGPQQPALSFVPSLSATDQCYFKYPGLGPQSFIVPQGRGRRFAALAPALSRGAVIQVAGGGAGSKNVRRDCCTPVVVTTAEYECSLRLCSNCSQDISRLPYCPRTATSVPELSKKVAHKDWPLTVFVRSPPQESSAVEAESRRP